MPRRVAARGIDQSSRLDRREPSFCLATSTRSVKSHLCGAAPMVRRNEREKWLAFLLGQEARRQIGWVGVVVEALTRIDPQFPGIDEVLLQVSGNTGGTRPFVLLGHVPSDIVGGRDAYLIDGAKWTALGVLGDHPCLVDRLIIRHAINKQ